jgi:predicted RNA-binding protein with PUA-like domain
MKLQYWLVKQEPDSYHWNDFMRDKRTSWEGVRNYQARNNLKAMQLADQVLFYASGDSKSVMGIAEVTQVAYPDKTTQEEGWVAVELKALKPLATPVTLAQIKQEPSLSTIALVRNSRLSVSSLTKDQFNMIIKLGK